MAKGENNVIKNKYTNVGVSTLAWVHKCVLCINFEMGLLGVLKGFVLSDCVICYSVAIARQNTDNIKFIMNLWCKSMHTCTHVLWI